MLLILPYLDDDLLSRLWIFARTSSSVTAYKNTNCSAWVKGVDGRQSIFVLCSVPIAEKNLLNFSATSNVDGVLQCSRHDSSIGASVSFKFFSAKTV